MLDEHRQPFAMRILLFRTITVCGIGQPSGCRKWRITQTDRATSAASALRTRSSPETRLRHHEHRGDEQRRHRTSRRDQPVAARLAAFGQHAPDILTPGGAGEWIGADLNYSLGERQEFSGTRLSAIRSGRAAPQAERPAAVGSVLRPAAKSRRSKAAWSSAAKPSEMRGNGKRPCVAEAKPSWRRKPAPIPDAGSIAPAANRSKPRQSKAGQQLGGASASSSAVVIGTPGRHRGRGRAAAWAGISADLPKT